MPTPVIQLIHHWAKNSKNPELEQPVLIPDDLGLGLLADPKVWRESTQDISASNLIGRVRRDDQPKNISWKDLALTIHGNTEIIIGSEFQNKPWGFWFFNYFNRDLKDEWFLTHNSTGELKFKAYGKAIFCTLGNHRVVAGRVWLLSRPNRLGKISQHAFKKVHISHYKLSNDIKCILYCAISKKGTIAVSKLINSDNSIYRDELVLRLTTSNSKEYFVLNYLLNNEKLSIINSLALKFNLYIADRTLLRVKWHDEIPEQVLKLLVEYLPPN